MAKMCSMTGCKEKKGLCIHEKMMPWMVASGAIFAIYYFGF